jgi:uncharacterized membrane protein YraQ (UPF0718 family)
MSTFLHQLLQVSLDAAPWLLLGLIVAGLIKVLIPVRWLNRWLGGGGIMPVINAALLGTPLPLCSCSVVPAALAIRRSGASRGATTSFLIATPENGADSLALSYALLGPVLMIARPVAAIVIAVATGFSVSMFVTDEQATTPTSTDKKAHTPTGSCCNSSAKSEPKTESSCCSSKSEPEPVKQSCCSGEVAKPEPAAKSCCSSGIGDAASNENTKTTAAEKWVEFYGAMQRLFNDIAFWLFVGLVLAALINTFISQGQIASWGSGLPAMILMVLVGVPMYICATSSTPVAASMLVAGVSPGTVLVFLLAGPATNLGTVGIIRKELGNKTAAIYLAGVAIGSIAFGLGLDALIGQMNLAQSISEHIHEHGGMLPAWLTYGSLATLALAMLAKFGSFCKSKLAKTPAAKSCCSSESASHHAASSCCSTEKSDKPKSSCCCSSE